MTVTMDLNAVELLCSRLCHDLVSPIGAINNGVELIEETGPSDTGEALDLIADSADAAAKRLKFFRLAFGSAGGQENLAPGDIRAVLEGWFRGGRVSLQWNVAAASPFPRGSWKLAMVSALVLEEALPRGGTLRVSEAGQDLLLVADGVGAAFRPEVRVALEDRVAGEPLTARTVVAHFAVRLATHYGFILTGQEDGQGHVSIRIGQK